MPNDAFEDVFAGLDATQRARLRELAVARRWRRGETLFLQGDGAGAAHVVMNGRLKVSVARRDGRELILAVVGPGTLLGHLAALTGRPRTATVSCLEDAQTRALPADTLRAAARRSPDLAFLLLEVAANELAAADAQRAEFAGFDVLGRVARRLVAIADEDAEPTADGLLLSTRLTQEDLASWTAASREGVNRAMQTVRSLGWVRNEGHRTIVCDLAALRAYAG